MAVIGIKVQYGGGAVATQLEDACHSRLASSSNSAGAICETPARYVADVWLFQLRQWISRDRIKLALVAEAGTRLTGVIQPSLQTRQRSRAKPLSQLRPRRRRIGFMCVHFRRRLRPFMMLTLANCVLTWSRRLRFGGRLLTVEAFLFYPFNLQGAGARVRPYTDFRGFRLS